MSSTSTGQDPAFTYTTYLFIGRRHHSWLMPTVLFCVWTGLAAAASPNEAAISKPAAGKTLGFVMSSFDRATYLGKDDCPDGFVPRGLDGLRASLPESERARLDRQNAKQRQKLDDLSGEGELCYRPDWFPAPPQPSVKGKISYGMDLDSSGAAQNTCPHENFVGPDGAAGIDNQFYRATGCMDVYFRDGARDVANSSYMRDGVSTNIIEITGVDDLRNDDDVRVGLYPSADAMEVGIGDGSDVLPHATLEIDTNPRFAADKHVPARGRIRDGILTTDPIDFVFKAPVPSEDVPYRFRGGRLRLELLPDGTAKGMVAAYEDVESAYWEATVLGTTLGRYFCPAFRASLVKFADGYPDPDTGRCTAISTAFFLTAVPVFIIHPTPAQFAAAAAAQKPDMPFGWERTLKKAEGNAARRKRLLEDHEILEPLVNRVRASQREVSP